MDASNQDINQGETDLGQMSKEECLAKCKEGSLVIATGCEYHATDQNCTMHSSHEVDSGDNVESYFCAIFTGKSFN